MAAQGCQLWPCSFFKPVCIGCFQRGPQLVKADSKLVYPPFTSPVDAPDISGIVAKTHGRRFCIAASCSDLCVDEPPQPGSGGRYQWPVDGNRDIILD